MISTKGFRRCERAICEAPAVLCARFLRHDQHHLAADLHTTCCRESNCCHTFIPRRIHCRLKRRTRQRANHNPIRRHRRRRVHVLVLPVASRSNDVARPNHRRRRQRVADRKHVLRRLRHVVRTKRKHQHTRAQRITNRMRCRRLQRRRRECDHRHDGRIHRCTASRAIARGPV